jgi:RNA polymerase sigma-70 factor (ECF subfamily)
VTLDRLNLRPVVPAEPPFAACARAFESEFDFVLRTLRRLGVRGSEGEDLAQEVFLVLWRRWGEYDPDRSLRAWLAGIAVKVACRHRDRARREIPRDDVEPADHLPGPEDQLVSSRARALVLSGLDRLSEKYRTVLVLHELDELSVRDIAAALEVPLFTVHTRLRRGRLMLAQWLSAQETPLHPDQLLQLERQPIAAPPGARERLQARLRALAARPPLQSLPAGPGTATRWHGPSMVVGALAAAAIVAVVAIGRPHPPRRAPAPVAVAPPAPPAAPAPALERGLVGHWTFDERAGAVARDLSGRGNDCRLRELDPAAAWVPGARGGAVDLGTKGWLECPQDPAPAGGRVALSVSAWVKRARAKSGAVIASRYLGPDGENFFHFGFKGDQLRVWGGSWRGWTAHELPGREDDWIHVAFTHAGPRTRLFLNGRLVAHDDNHRVRGSGTATRPLIIGGSDHGPGIWQHLDGAVDEVRIYDRALSDAEIAALSRR